MTSDLGGAPQQVRRVKLTTTNMTEIIPAARTEQVIQPIKIINEHTADLSVSLYATLDAVDTITWKGTVSAGDTLTLNEPEFIGQSMSLRAQCGTANQITVTAIVRGSQARR